MPDRPSRTQAAGERFAPVPRRTCRLGQTDGGDSLEIDVHPGCVEGERQSPQYLERQLRELQAREHSLQEREQAADERERLADERERIADRRERVADERERIADQRERLADERQIRSEQREVAAREQQLQTDQLARALGVLTASREQRAREAIDHARDHLAESAAKLSRSEALIDRYRTRDARAQDAIDREVASTERAQQQQSST